MRPSCREAFTTIHDMTSHIIPTTENVQTKSVFSELQNRLKHHFRISKRTFFLFHFRKTACLEEGSDVTSSDSDLQHFSDYANSAGSEAQDQYSSEDDNGDLPTTEINTEKKQDDLGISKQIKGC